MTTTSVDDAPHYTRAQVDNCAFAVWYPRFEHVAVKGVVVPLPSAFVSLLLADGVVLPDALAAQEQQLALESVRTAVNAVLARFKRKVFPKLNWTSPRDASWMLGTMQCVNFEDVFLLLKSSDFAVHDITEAYAGCIDSSTVETASEDVLSRPHGPNDVYLVLKKWCSLFDSMLFRCFVADRRLVGICQRNVDEYFPFLSEQQDDLCELIYTFFTTHFGVQDSKFPDADYIVDVYVDKQRRVHLLDINVFGSVTDPLLFTWSELLELRTASERAREAEEVDEVQDVVDFRIVESAQSIRPNPLSGYRVPTDLVDHLAGGAGFEAFMDQVKRDNARVDSDSDSEEEEQEEEDEEDEDVLWGSDNDD